MKYYIQDTRQYVGNSILWWAKNESGYTTDLSKAGKFTEKRALEICRRDTDRAFPCDYIDSRASTHVDMQRIEISKALEVKR